MYYLNEVNLMKYYNVEETCTWKGITKKNKKIVKGGVKILKTREKEN